MTKEELLRRTKNYSIAIARLVLSLPNNLVNRNYADQLNRSASSTGANYRAACRAKSTADFINKLKIVEEELDETIYWMELLVEAGLLALRRLDALMKEADELLAIFVSAIK